MSNMSYCRFENTARDLDDCQTALEELLNGSASEPLSASELAAAKRLAGICIDIVSVIEDAGMPFEDADEAAREVVARIDEANRQVAEAQAEAEADEDERDVEIDPSPFVRAHGRGPRGSGRWAFAHDPEIAADDDRIFWFNGNYSDAIRAVIAHFAAQGVGVVYVLS